MGLSANPFILASIQLEWENSGVGFWKIYQATGYQGVGSSLSELGANERKNEYAKEYAV